ncbi:MAG TPA: alkaline phosphatase family protein [Acidimicrobiales bacterium]|nr:alkaline phosphatase family protein [Acidimicrobiales bacterium]
MRRLLTAALALVGLAWIAVPSAGLAGASATSIPRFQHVFEIMMENTDYADIIGNPAAPNLNSLADTYGLATDYFGVTHPSEPNYVAAMSGDYWGIQDDNQFYCTPALATTDTNCTGTTVPHTLDVPNLASQLQGVGKSWRGYFQSLPPTPPPGQVIMDGPNANGPYTYKYPSSSVALYASKHNPFVNFTSTQTELSNMVPDTQLSTDLASGNLADFSFIVPDQCHDMHGTGGCGPLIPEGDAYVGATVSAIMSAKFWASGRNAIVITWDEDDYADSGLYGTGCCGSNPGGGQVATIVITNKGPIHVVDATPYNHYSLLRTFEDAFGLPGLANACRTDVTPLTPLFDPKP